MTSCLAFINHDMRRYSLKSSLLILVLLCVLPSTAINIWLLSKNADLRRSQAELDTLLLARQVAAELESELAAIESALKVLASSPELQRGDLRGFQDRAQSALASGKVYNYILTDRDGRQIMNTLRPFGVPLPSGGTPAQIDAVFSSGETVLTNLFMGPVTRKLAIAMGVPVKINGRIVYSLNIGLSPNRINQILARQRLPKGWLIAILDQSGTIVARSREADRYVGEKSVPPLRAALAKQVEARLRVPTKEGYPAFTAFKPAQRWQWGVAVGLHESVLYADLQATILRLVLGTSFVVIVALGLALLLASRILAMVRSINDAARAISRGQPFQVPHAQFREAEALSDALVQASKAMTQVTFQSRHDALTLLPNRTMFSEFAERQLSLAQRNNYGMAVIAIDLDHFKSVNDTQGHAAGDAVLIEAARRIEQSVRSSDIAARLGGDEFLVLLSETDPALALRTANRIVEALGQPYTATTFPVSGSAGVALYPQDGVTMEDLIAMADKALYAAKSAGRSCALHAGSVSRQQA